MRAGVERNSWLPFVSEIEKVYSVENQRHFHDIFLNQGY